MTVSSFLPKIGSSRRPNIIIILADDMGISDLGCYGSEIDTPNLDRLAHKGMRFTQFYNCSRCSPSRASLLTGLYPHKAGMGKLANEPDPRKPAYQGYLNDRCLTIAEVLKPAGYHRLMSGKWHIGENSPHWPLERGFEKYYGLIGGVSNYFDPNLVAPGTNKKATIVRDNTPITEFSDDFYLTDAITDEAVKMIYEYGQKDNPFFLYVAHVAPHWPLNALPEEIEKYQGKFLEGWDVIRERRYQRMIQKKLLDPNWTLSQPDEGVRPWENVNQDWEDRRMAIYAAQIDRMDQGIGKIVDTLKELGIEKNTLVMFLSDNGASSELDQVEPDWENLELKVGYGRGWANVSNTPFQRYKVQVYEGGISTPLIARWRGVIQPGTITDEIGHIIDLMPTCLDVAGVEYPEQITDKQLIPLDGKSLLPILQGNTRPDYQTLYWEHQGNRAIRQGKWKLVFDAKLKKWELYDLEADRTETENLAEDYPQLVQEMSAEWQTWANAVEV